MFEQLAAGNVYSQAVKEICRAVKLHNPQSLIKVNEADILDFVNVLKMKYSESVVRQAKEETLAYYADSSLTLGKFQELCNALTRAKQNEINTQQYLKTPKQMQKDKVQENIKALKEMLKEANIPKKLPYNKEMRVSSYEGRKASENPRLPPVEACDHDMPIWEKTCFSDGPALYAKCVVAGQTTPIEMIKDPELKRLYEKAWTKGLEAAEKERFNELSRGWQSLYK